MDATQVSDAGRLAAQGLMTDACRIERVGSVVTSDDGTDTAPVTVLYEGPCRLKPSGTRGTAQPSTDAPTEVWQYKLSIPIGGEEIRAFDAVVMTVSPRDPSVVGKRLQVRNIDRGTSITARRIYCTEVSR